MVIVGSRQRRENAGDRRRDEDDQSGHEEPSDASLGRCIGRRPEQVALAWITRQPGVVAIPKAGTLAHLQQNFVASAIELDAAELQAIDARFPRPRCKTPLAMI